MGLSRNVPAVLPSLDASSLLDSLRAEHERMIINKQNKFGKFWGSPREKSIVGDESDASGATAQPGRPETITKLSNGFVLPPPVSVDADSPLGSNSEDYVAPTFRITRTTKGSGLGFYPIYTSYKNQSTRIYTTVKVTGNVLDFISCLHTMVVMRDNDRERLLNVKGREDFLDDVRPAVGGGWKVRVRGRWKKEIEAMIWGMGM